MVAEFDPAHACQAAEQHRAPAGGHCPTWRD